MNTTAERLLTFKSKVPSKWRENALLRLNNQEERKKARKLAMKILNYIDDIGMSSHSFAERLGIDYETLLPILKGHTLPSEDLSKKINALLML
ncbi:MAG: hypothetical protein K2K98_00605 [Muribaculaceae bacterium]|nr:hypothetical protein [Muribaculaceae bacterium]